MNCELEELGTERYWSSRGIILTSAYRKSGTPRKTSVSEPRTE
jgi:hypothetical protein